MLVFFLGTLQTRLDGLEKTALASQEVGQLRSEIERLKTAKEPSWDDAYGLERSIAILAPLDSLFWDLSRRVNRECLKGVSGAQGLQKDLEEAKKCIFKEGDQSAGQLEQDRARRLLLSVLIELQRFKQVKHSSKKYEMAAILWTTAFVIAFGALLISPFFLVVHGCPWPILGENLPLAITLFAGAFGAYFSRLLRLQKGSSGSAYSRFTTSHLIGALALRGAVGVCGALFVFFFLQSGVVEGSLFPKMSEVEFTIVDWPDGAMITARHEQTPSRPELTFPLSLGLATGGPAAPEKLERRSSPPWHFFIPSKALALLVVWGFLAGFSERLVPNILSSTDQRLTGAVENIKA